MVVTLAGLHQWLLPRIMADDEKGYATALQGVLSSCEAAGPFACAPHGCKSAKLMPLQEG